VNEEHKHVLGKERARKRERERLTTRDKRHKEDTVSDHPRNFKLFNIGGTFFFVNAEKQSWRRWQHFEPSIFYKMWTIS
jgi:hypothetical protein